MSRLLVESAAVSGSILNFKGFMYVGERSAPADLVLLEQSCLSTCSATLNCNLFDQRLRPAMQIFGTFGQRTRFARSLLGQLP
jgi:hypothetical protein